MAEPIFVGRDAELARLQSALERSLVGTAQVVFVAGEAGAGKTALLREFARRAQQADSTLVVAVGNCNAQTGLGDPYLPFREVLRLLTGDVDAEMADNAVNAENANRLRGLLVHTAQVLVEVSPDLTGLLLAGIPGAALAARIGALLAKKAGLSEKLDKLSRRPQPAAVDPDLDQNRIFEQYTSALKLLSAQCPIVIVLDDMQWADSASVQLLFHLCRQMAGSRVLILGAYRPDEVALGRAGQPHPLEKVLAESKRYFGDIVLDLAQSDEHERRCFVDALLDAEPNRLETGFRDALFHHTEGHPLYAIELLRDMQERGDLLRDAEGRWVEAPSLSWDALPARVEGVVQERIQRLDHSLREMLSIASVEGQEFTLQIIARLQNVPERSVVRSVSQELDKRHHLVLELAEVKVGKQMLFRFQFSHALFQQYLYNELSAAERRLLHEDMARLLEELYDGHTDEIAVQLARHYSEAGDAEKAVSYLIQAGDQARALYAHEEAVGYYQRALKLLKEQHDYARAARILMKLGLTYQIGFDFRRAREAYEEGFGLWQHASEPPDSMPAAPHALRIFGSDPATLDAGLVADADAMRPIEHLFCGLVERRPDMDVLPDLALSWEMLEDGRRYVFHLRKDVHWSDGVPVTAGDLEYAWKRALDPKSQSPNASLLYDIQGARALHQGLCDPAQVAVRAADDSALIVDLDGPCGYFLHLLAHPVCFALPRHAIEVYGESWTDVDKIVTCGPFSLESYQKGSGMTLVRNPGYSGHRAGNVQRVEVHFLPDWSARLEAYETDRLDIGSPWASAPIERDRVRQRHAGEYLSVPALTTCFVRFDVTRPPFDDVRVRRALVLATDREKVAGVASRGFSSPALGGLVPPGVPGHSPRVGTPYDPEQARQLLAQAGYEAGAGFPVVEASVTRAFLAESEYLAWEWQQLLGIRVAWQTMSTTESLDRVAERPPHLLLDGWLADYPDPDNFLRVARQYFLPMWTNQAYDALVEQARRLVDQAQRMRLYEQAEAILAQEAPLLLLTHSRAHLLIKPWVTRFPTSPIRQWFWKDVVIEPH